MDATNNTSTENLIDQMTDHLGSLALPVDVTTRQREEGGPRCVVTVTAQTMGRDGLAPVKAARGALIDWIRANGAATADKKIVNIRDHKGNVVFYTFCDRHPEYLRFSVRVTDR